MAAPIAKVPNEIILLFAKYVDQEYSVAYYNVGRNMSKKPIVNFAMVCRRFRLMSAHLLVPLIHVSFQTSCLERLEEISRHELIRKGVRKLRVSLSHFTEEVCGDFAKFVEFYASGLEKHCKEDDSGPKKGEAAWECHRVLKSWKRIMRKVQGEHLEREDDEEVIKHRALMEEAYANYQQLYTEQEHLFRSGEFIHRVALAVFRMPLVEDLIFEDIPFRRGGVRKLWNPPVRLGVDVRDAYYQAMKFGMAGRQTWGTSRHDIHFAKSLLYPTLIQLPIALHQAGVMLKHLEIRLEGLHGDGILGADSDILQALSSAFQSLKEVTFEGCPVFEGLYDGGKDFEGLPAYLAQALTSPHLQVVHIDPCRSNEFVLHGLIRWQQPGSWARLPGSMLSVSSKIDRSHLTEVVFFKVDFQCTDLLAFISSLPGTMAWLHLDEVQLLDGSWEVVLGRLRNKRVHQLILDDLWGCEFNTMTTGLRSCLFKLRRGGFNCLTLYCRGHCGVNPFMAIRDDNWENWLVEAWQGRSQDDDQDEDGGDYDPED